MDIVKYNRGAWDQEVEKNNPWTIPVTTDDIVAARRGEWRIVLTPTKPVPEQWFPKLDGIKVLCLASGGGQQGPILAAAGGEVTVLDNSPKQLAQDEMVARRDGLAITTVQGDMRDLSGLEDESFDLIVHPVSNLFVDNIIPVWKEAYRVLKPNGALLAGFLNPIVFIFDDAAWEAGRLDVRHRIPYADTTHLTDAEREELLLKNNEPLSFGHSLADQIQGQIDAGFVITGFYEDNSGGNEPLDPYIDSFAATRAVKLPAQQ